MEIRRFDIEGPVFAQLKTFGDDRGFFTERYRENAFKEAGLPTHFAQENFSRSKPGVLRGLHYQWTPAQGKLVTCTSGRIFDVAVDIRANSPTKGKHVTVELDGAKPAWFWIPPGFAHGFLVLGTQEADVLYKVDNYWNGQGEAGLQWNDPDFAIDWPVKSPILSPKDAQTGSWKDYLKNPRF